MQDVQSNEQVNPQSGSNGQTEADPLAKLYRMSTTAGVGTQDYVAINPTAVVALLLGFSSILVILSNVLIVIPVVGIVCAIVALVQIRRSFNTQTGRGLAVFGLLLCLLVTGGRVGYEQLNQKRLAADEDKIAALMKEFGQDINAEQYDKAYQLMDDRFRNRVPLTTFEGTFKSLKTAGPYGGVQAVEWNNQAMTFEDRPDSDNTYASAMAFYRFATDPQPRRVIMGFEKTSDGWRINDIEMIFPTKKATPQ